MRLSDFGHKMTDDAGILQLMDDLGKAMAGEPPLAMFGGGNPAQIPAVTKAYKQVLENILKSKKTLPAMLGNYDTPQGNADFIQSVVTFMNRHYKLSLTAANVAITPGSQAGYFMLFNLLAGKHGRQNKKILFPMVPEYVGYADQGIVPDMFTSRRPKIIKKGSHEFKYAIDFDSLNITSSVAALCVSRPTNPSGNVITDEELAALGSLAEKHDIPLLIDNAYGMPFPGVIVPEAKLFWHNHTVLSLSLSKIGLPASRVGIFIGPPDLMQALSSANAVLSLASPSFGQYLVQPLLENDTIVELSKSVIQPYYFERAGKTHALMQEHMPDELPWRLHTYEGSYFLWLWCESIPISSKELYDRLKARGVLVVPGEYFFPGQDTAAWPHARETVRLNFARPNIELEAGIPIVAEEIAKAYKQK